LKLASESINESPPPPAGRKDVYFDGNWEQVPLYLLDKLKSGDKFKSPALIIGNAQAVFVEADANVFILSSHVVIKSGQESGRTNGDLSIVKPIQLFIFGHRFMSISEQTGNTLQRTSARLLPYNIFCGCKASREYPPYSKTLRIDAVSYIEPT
jgi:5-oxoprolinase (ATP-hydrolysing)